MFLEQTRLRVEEHRRSAGQNRSLDERAVCRDLPWRQSTDARQSVDEKVKRRLAQSYNLIPYPVVTEFEAQVQRL